MPHPNTIEELRAEIHRLQTEQDRLRKEIETDGHNGHGSPDAKPLARVKQPDSQRDGAKPSGLNQPESKPDQKLLEAPKPAAQEEPPKAPLRQRSGDFVRRHPLGIVMGVVLFVAVGIGLFFLLRYFNSYESTDDAFVDGHLDPIGSRIAGTAVSVPVENNQFVVAGQVLAVIDPRDYDTALQQAQAAYAQSQAQIQAESPNVPIQVTTSQTNVSTGQSGVENAQAAVASAERDYEARLADIRQTEAQNIKAQQDVKRYQLLVAKDEISRQQFDAAVATANSQQATVQAAQASAEAANKTLDQRRAQLAEAQSRLAEAQNNAPRQVASRQADLATRRANAAAARAQLEQARLNLSYTQIIAPVGGVVANKVAEVGSHVLPGQDLLSISEIADLWITANFKETQLQRMRPGQSVTIHVDAFDVNLDGYIDSMPAASGAVSSLLPPENATGNYVKVVQRLPVRIRLKQGQDSEHRLRIGMSVEPKVWL